MVRNWHYLRRSNGVGWPKSQCVLSLSLREGTPGCSSATRLTVALDSWGAVAWRDLGAGPVQEISAGGNDAQSFWRFLSVVMRRGERLWLWCRGMAHALSVVGGWAVISGKAPTLCIVSDPPTVVDTSLPGIAGSIRFLDSRNVGLDDTEGQLEPRERAAAMCLRLRQYQQLTRDLDLGGLRCTVAAQAWHGWRHKYLTCPVEVHNDTARLLVEKAACFGGRCEVFRAGIAQGPVYEIDAQAHYPSCASDAPLPARTCRPTDVLGLTAESAAQRGLLVIARGRVHTDVPCVPCAWQGRVVFPVGSWPAVYCWPEVELIRRCGGEFRVKDWWAYEAANPCGTYMRTLWTTRRDCAAEFAPGRQHGAKLLANSLVGRIGTLGHSWEHVPEVFHPDPWSSWWEAHPRDGLLARWRTICSRVEVETISGWGDESIPAVAAWVYSVGRVRLYEWMRIAGFENVLYCDTDSLWTNAEGECKIREAGELRPGEMGRLRVKNVHSWARFYGVKHYDSPAGVKWAGVPRNSVSALDGKWAYTYSESPGRAARAGRPPVSELLKVEVPDGRSYLGGRIGAGGIVYPWEVYQDDEA
jgi:hypothetical protein